MKPLEVAQALKAIRQKELACTKSAYTVYQIADAIVTVDLTSAASPFPSANKNGVYFFGCEGDVSKADVVRIRGVFEKANVERFFFHLGPAPQEKEIAAWLKAEGFNPFVGPQYPTLVRAVESTPLAEARLRIARVAAQEIETREDEIASIFDPWPSSFFVESRGQAGFDHFLAYDDETPVSAAMLISHDKFAYLAWAATAEAHRGKGGQNALIRARLNRAAELGCQVACSETLTILETSLRNLIRNGFEWLYEKRVYCYEA